MKTFFIWAAAVVAALAFLGFAIWAGMSAAADGERASNEWRDSPRNPVNVCIAQGGVPITSAWDGRLTTCQFKEAE